MNIHTGAAGNSAIANAILDKIAQRLEDHQSAINANMKGHFTRGDFLNGLRNSFCPCLGHGNDDGKDNRPSLLIYFNESYNLKFKCKSSSPCTPKKIEETIKSLGIELMNYNGWVPIDPEKARATPPAKSPQNWDKDFGKLAPTTNLTPYYNKDGWLNHITCRLDVVKNGVRGKVIRPLTYCQHENGLVAWRFLQPTNPCLLGEHLLSNSKGCRKLIVEGEK
jgi:hypothetical protein